MFIQGKARRVGDNVNTDQMYPTLLYQYCRRQRNGKALHGGL